MKPRYTVTTWDSAQHRFTRQDGLGMRSANIPLWDVRRVLKRLRQMGYSCHRFKIGGDVHSDPSVLVEKENSPNGSRIRVGSKGR